MEVDILIYSACPAIEGLDETLRKAGINSDRVFTTFNGEITIYNLMRNFRPKLVLIDGRFFREKIMNAGMYISDAVGDFDINTNIFIFGREESPHDEFRIIKDFKDILKFL